MAILDAAKLALRISNTAYDSEITDLIDACKKELNLKGLLVVDETDILVKRAIILYVKANFGWDNKDAEKLQKSYEMLRNHLTLSEEYAFYKVTINTSEQQIIIFDGERKETNDEGTAIFHCRAKDHVEYIVADSVLYIDIAGDTIIEVN